MTSFPVWGGHLWSVQITSRMVLYLHAKFGGNRTNGSGSRPWFWSVEAIFSLWRHFRFGEVTSGQCRSLPRWSSTCMPNLVAIGPTVCLSGPDFGQSRLFLAYDVTSGLGRSLPVSADHFPGGPLPSCKIWWRSDQRFGRSLRTHTHTQTHTQTTAVYI